MVLLLLLQANRATALQASFTVTNGTGCAPLNVQFNNTSVGAASYYWDFGDGNTSVLANPTDIYLNTGFYTVKLVAYDGNGLADSLIMTNAVQVIQQPQPAFTANVTSVCIENNVVFFTNNSASYDSCLWDFGDGGTSSAINPSYSYAIPGVYSVTLICYNTANGCSSSLTQNQYITVSPSPVTTVSVNANTSCDPSFVFSFSASSGPGSSFNWNFGDNTGSALQNPSHVYGTPGVYDVTVITTSNMGCSDTVFLDNYIDLKSNPVPGLSLSDSSGCLPFSFFANALGGPFSSCLFTFGNGDSLFSYTNFYSYTTAGTYTITATVTYPNGCTNSNSYSQVQALTTPVSNISLSNNYGCAPRQVTFTNNSSGGISYLWNFGDGTTSAAFTPTHTYNNNGTYWVTLTVTSANGCTAVSGGQEVKVQGPGASIFADVTSGCPPLTVNFIGNPAGQSSYYWDFGDGFTSAQPNPQHVYNNVGNFQVTLAVTNGYGCTDTVTIPTTISVASPSANFATPPPVSGCAPMYVSLSDNTPDATSWLWNFGDGNTGTGQNTDHTYFTPGTYTVTLSTASDSGGCPQFINNFSTFIVGGGEANFTYTQSLCPPYEAWFQDSSLNAVSWLWDFGDGTTSNLQNPNHIYAQPGVYNVSLTITTADGCVITCIHNYALNFEPLFSNASAFTTDTVLPMTVLFNANTTGATSWFWTFGDGGTSSLENPTHVYTTPGPYNITLTIANDSCTFSYAYPPTNIGAGNQGLGSTVDSIHAPPPRTGCAPLAVNFHNPFINTISWKWDFGDGDTSNLPNPMHIYMQTGTYDVKVYGWHANGDVDSLIETGSVIVTGSANADFTIAHSNSCSGTTISLAPVSGNIAGYSWNFGDGASSTDSNPVHTYPNNGTNYIISLIATDSSGCIDFMTKSFYASMWAPLHASNQNACGSDSVYFDCGNMQFSSYVWHFGDGDSSLFPTTWHQYADSGTYQVTLTVTDTAGCEQTFTLPAPVQIYDPVPSFTMFNYPNCVGVHVIFTNTSLNADSYLWDFGDSTFSTNPNPAHLYANPGYYTVSLTAFKNNCSTTYTLPNGIHGLNTTVNFSYVQDQQCLPVTITCTDMSTDVVSWQWDFGDGTTSLLQHPTHTFNSIPSDSIELKVTNANGCWKRMRLPNIQATVAGFALSDSSGCSPLAISFQDSSLQAATWEWNFGDGTTSKLPNPQHTYLTDGTYQVSLVVQAASGCRDSLGFDSLITVSSLAAAFASNKNADCAPAIIDFTDLSGNADTWTWDFGDGSSSQLADPTHIYTTPGVYDVKLVVSNAYGCLDSLVMPAMITVNGPITGFAASDTGGCMPVTVQFTDTSSNAFTWLWSFGDGSSSNAVNPQHIYGTAGQYVVSLITEDSLGCQSLFSYPFPISVNELPVASFTVSDTAGCTPFAVMFTDSSLHFDSLYWNFGDGNTTTNTSSVTYTYTTAGTFYPYLVAFSNAGCADTFYLSQPVRTEIQPAADFTTGSENGCAPFTASFINLSTGLAGTTTYLWEFGNGDTSTLPNPGYTFLLPGVYTITLTVTNGNCTSTTIKDAYIHVYDQAPPPVSPIVSVSVLNNSSVQITWKNSAVTDLGAYVLYRLDQQTGNFNVIFTENNPNNSNMNVISSYTDTLLNTLQHTYTYKLQTVDLCQNALPLDSLGPHTTINITAQTQGNGIYLSWTPYLGCVINQYQLYRNDPSSGQYQLIASLPSGQADYYDTSLVCPELYAYRVTATDLCGDTYTSDSDTSMAKPENALNDQQVEVVRTTVIDDENTLTEWKPPVLAPQDVVAYIIYRSETMNGPYTLVATVGANVLSYIDNHTAVHEQNYFYQIEVVNRCNAETMLSNLGSSVLLLGTADGVVTRLVWTAYKGWDTGVSQYVIERQNANGGWDVIRVVDGNTFQAEDK